MAEIGKPFREDAVKDAIAAVREARAHADKVFLLFVPRNPCFLPAEFTERADRLIARFVTETGLAPGLQDRGEEPRRVLKISCTSSR